MYPLRLIHDLRPALPWTIYSLPVHIAEGSAPALHEQRFAIYWDEDNDERIFAAVLDVFYRRPEALWKLYAVGERKGNLTIWAQAFPTADQNAWSAASGGPAIQDVWPVRTIHAVAEIKRTGGMQAPQKLDEDYIVRKFPSEHDQLNWLINLFDLGPSGPRRAW